MHDASRDFFIFAREYIAKIYDEIFIVGLRIERYFAM